MSSYLSFEAENVERCLGLLQTNGVTSCSVGGAARGHALYPVFSIVNNSCVANTRSAADLSTPRGCGPHST
jgi:hypothetical protein